MGTSGAGWEAPEDPLDRDPPRPRGVAWPRLRRSRSAQCTTWWSGNLNESNLCGIFLISSTLNWLYDRRYELEMFLREVNILPFQKLIQGEA